MLHVAALLGSVEILRAVIEHGADVNAVNMFQEAALHKAAAYGKVEAANALGLTSKHEIPMTKHLFMQLP